MPWRWNLDYVVDPNGNTTAYFYQRDESRYSALNGLSPGERYVRSSILTEIRYGGRVGESIPAAKVVFHNQFRCVDLDDQCDEPVYDPNPDDPNNPFPDVPTDLLCPGTSCLVHAPTFFSTRRYSSVVTYVTVPVPGDEDALKPVAVHNLLHNHWAPSGQDKRKLYLKDIQRVGLLGGQLVPEPATSFLHIEKPNRVDVASPTSEDAMAHARLMKITLPTGGTISIGYTQPRLCESDYRPEPWDTNDRDCFPQTIVHNGSRTTGCSTSTWSAPCPRTLGATRP